MNDKWVNVKEKLPPERFSVLLYCKPEISLSNDIILAYMEKSGKWYSCELYKDEKVEPFYWMFLPNPPEVEK